MLLLIILIIVAIAILSYYYVLKPLQYWKNKNVKQGTTLSILSDSVRTTLQLVSIVDFIKTCYNDYKGERYFGIYQASLPTFVLRDPELIKQIAVKDFDHFVDRMNFGNEDYDPLWSRNLVSLRGEKWKSMRAVLSPTFTASKMRTMFHLMEKSAKQYVNFYLNQKQDIVELELKDSFTRIANDVIANCAFGIEVDSLQFPTNEFYLHGKAATNFSGFWTGLKFMAIMFLPTLSKMLNFTIFPPATSAFFKKIVKDSVKLREEKNIVRPDVIHLLMEARKGKIQFDESTEKHDMGFATVEESDLGKALHNKQIEMSDDDMAAQVVIFFFAGFDTISTVMSFLCYELALHPEIQERLRQEIESTYQSTNGELTYDALNKMKYLDMVVSESLRKDPPAAMVDRMCTKAYTVQPEKPGEVPVELKVGEVVWLPVFGIHRDEQYYPNPDKFDPERFNDENKANINPYAYLAFGAGPRNCVGSRFALMEVKTILYHLLHKFELVVIGKTPIPMKYDKSNFNPTFEGGCWIGFKKRD